MAEKTKAAAARPRVSIVTRTKDRPLLLARALDSVLSQSLADWQHIIVNDGGDPDPVDALVAMRRDAYAGRVTVLHNERSGGMEAASNKGVALATGEFLSIHDDDDRWDPEFLAACTEFLDAQPDLFQGVVTRSVRIIEEIRDGGVVELSRELFPASFSLARVNLAYLSTHNQFPPISFLYRRSVLDQIGHYREDLPVLGDWEFNLRFASRYEIGVLDRPLAYWHNRDAASGGSSVLAGRETHLKYDALIRHTLLRDDLGRGSLGLGYLANIHALTDDTEDRNQRFGAIEDQVSRTRFAVGMAHEAVNITQASIAHTGTGIRQEIGKLRADFEQLSHDRLIAQMKAESLREEIAALRGSSSWRLTAPLRWGVARVHAVKALVNRPKPAHDTRVNLRFLWARRAQLRFVLSALMRRPHRARAQLSVIRALRRSAAIDVLFYRDRNPDVAATGIHPLLHYVFRGAAEGRDPNPGFDSAFYLRSNPDVAAAGINPLYHYVTRGAAEGRQPHPPFAGPEAEPVEAFPNAEAWYDAETPEVSIVILNWNKSRLTSQCLKDLWRHTTGHRYEIVLVDNGSNPAEFAELTEILGPFRIVRLGQNRFFGEGNNIGVEASRGTYLCLMNNDIFVTENWLPPLMRMLAEQPDAGGVGPKFLYPDGRMQEGGALIDRNGDAVQLGKLKDPDDPEFNQMRTVDYISAATFLLKRELFDRVLGFDLCWDPAYYEDADLCFKIGLLGLKIYYCPETAVFHVENATSSDARHGLKLNNIVEINKGKFVARWGKYIGGDRSAVPNLLGDGAPAPRTPERRPGLPRIALSTHYDLLPGGGEKYLLTAAEALSIDHEVTLVTAERYSRLRLVTIARELNLDLSRIHMEVASEAQRDGMFDIGITMGNEILPPSPGLGRRNLYHCQFPFPLAATERARRWRFWEDYERLVVNSEFTKRYVERQQGQIQISPLPVDVVHPPVDMIGIGGPKKPMILHVGRFFTGGHCKRQDTLVQLFREMVEKDGVQAELHLVGSLHPEAHHRDYYLQVRELARDLPVFFHINASRETLTRLYREARVYWHATGIGSDAQLAPETLEHFGISIVEAMSAGCIPVVYREGGPGLIVEDGRTGHLFSNVEQLRGLTLPLLRAPNDAGAVAMGEAAAAAAQGYERSVFMNQFRDLAAGLLGR